jgi:hypothetical protein
MEVVSCISTSLSSGPELRVCVHTRLMSLTGLLSRVDSISLVISLVVTGMRRRMSPRALGGPVGIWTFASSRCSKGGPLPKELKSSLEGTHSRTEGR